MDSLLDDVFSVVAAPAFERDIDARNEVGISRQQELCLAAEFVAKTEILFCKLLRFVHCSNLGGDFKLLIVRVFGVSLDLGDALNTLSGFGVDVGHPARRILRIGCAGAELIRLIAVVIALDGADFRLLLILSLIEQHEDSVCCLEGDTSIMAKLRQKLNVAHVDLLDALIIWVAVRFIHAGHTAAPGDFIRNAAERVAFPCLALAGLPELRRKRNRRSFDADCVWWPAAGDVVKLKFSARQHRIGAVAVPVLTDKHNVHGESFFCAAAIGGCTLFARGSRRS